MTYNIKFSSESKQPFTIDNGKWDGLDSSDGQHTTLTLFGKGSSDYGEALWTNLVHMLENHCSTNHPTMPTEGQLWYDNTNRGTLKVYKTMSVGSQLCKWYDIIDENTLSDRLSDPNFYRKGAWPADVDTPRDGTTVHGDVIIDGDLTVKGHLYAYRSPEQELEVLNLKFFNSYTTDLPNHYLPLSVPKTGSTVTGNVTFKGTLHINGTGTLDKNVADFVSPNEIVNKRYVDSFIGSANWPSQTKDTVLATDGHVPYFSKVLPSFISPTTTLSSNKYNVLTSDNTAVSWKNLDVDYVTVSGSLQDITGDKHFVASVDFAGEVKLNSSVGNPGDVFTSNGPGGAPSWKASVSSLPPLSKGVLVSNGTATSWIDGSAGQVLSTNADGTFKWIDGTSNPIPPGKPNYKISDLSDELKLVLDLANPMGSWNLFLGYKVVPINGTVNWQDFKGSDTNDMVNKPNNGDNFQYVFYGGAFETKLSNSFIYNGTEVVPYDGTTNFTIDGVTNALGSSNTSYTGTQWPRTWQMIKDRCNLPDDYLDYHVVFWWGPLNCFASSKQKNYLYNSNPSTWTKFSLSDLQKTINKSGTI